LLGAFVACGPAAAAAKAASQPAATKPSATQPSAHKAAAPAAPSAKAPSAKAPAAQASTPKPVRLVDINSAAKAQLKTLPGIGDAEAERIIAARPYLTKTDLVVKKVLPAGVYVSIKGRIVARQKPGSPPVARDQR
jgi:DNA uptake protein ComE-like DNA-binding protein